jgi:hypothetical protein
VFVTFDKSSFFFNFVEALVAAEHSMRKPNDPEAEKANWAKELQ